MTVLNLNMKNPTREDVEFHRREYLEPALIELNRRKALNTPHHSMVVFETAVQSQERIAALLEIRASKNGGQS